MDTSPKRAKSREYPAISLRKAVDLARRIYEKDRWAEAPALTAVKHMGYAGLNGNSRPALSALKKYGLVEYLASSDNMRVKLTDLARRTLLPVNEAERSAAVWEALSGPAVRVELLDAFPDWDLPSDETLAARLERELGLQHAGVKPFIADLHESLEFARGSAANHDGPEPTAGGPAQPPPDMSPTAHDEVQMQPARGMMRLPMPGSSAYIVLPESMQPAEAKRVLSWLRRVVTPAVEFASDLEDVDEAE